MVTKPEASTADGIPRDIEGLGGGLDGMKLVPAWLDATGTLLGLSLKHCNYLLLRLPASIYADSMHTPKCAAGFSEPIRLTDDAGVRRARGEIVVAAFNAIKSPNGRE
jgi:hypothetical protein